MVSVRLPLGINADTWWSVSDLLFERICLTFRLCLFQETANYRVEDSYLQPESWLRSSCDLLPWPRGPAVISPQGLQLLKVPRALHIFKHFVVCLLWWHHIKYTKHLLWLFFFHALLKLLMGKAISPWGCTCFILFYLHICSENAKGRANVLL